MRGRSSILPRCRCRPRGGRRVAADRGRPLPRVARHRRRAGSRAHAAGRRAARVDRARRAAGRSSSATLAARRQRAACSCRPPGRSRGCSRRSPSRRGARVGDASAIVGRQPFTPPLTVMASVALLVVSLIVFARHAHALADAANPYAVVATLGASRDAATERRYPPVCPPELPEPPELQLGRVVPAPRSRLRRRRRRAASRARGDARQRDRDGPGSGRLRHAGRAACSRSTRSTAGGFPPASPAPSRLADVRDARADAAFGLGLLVGRRDRRAGEEPGVAEAALDRIGEILGRLGPRPFPTGRYADARGGLRVLQPVIGWPRLAEIALADIALRGAADPRVRERLSALVDQLSRRLPPERVATLAPYAPAPRPHPAGGAPRPRRRPRRAAALTRRYCPSIIRNVLTWSSSSPRIPSSSRRVVTSPAASACLIASR